MKRVILAILIVMSAMGVSYAQVDQEAVKRSQAVMDRRRQLDILGQVLPLSLKKDQILKLLPQIEKNREKVRRIEKQEADELKLIEADADKAYQDGIKKGAVPRKETLQKISRLFLAFYIRRNAAANESADDMLVVVKGCFTAEQLKTAANMANIRAYDPKADIEKMSEDDKLRFFIKDVLLDKLSYEVFLQLSKVAS